MKANVAGPMQQQIEILNPIDYVGWDELLASNRECTFFHTSAWAKVLCQTYHYRPLYFTVLDNNKLLALFPIMEVKSMLTGVRGVSLPFTDYCEPINASGIELLDIISFVAEYARKHHWKFIESRGGHYPGETPSTSVCRHTLDLTLGVAEIFSRFDSSTKRNIKKSRREGVKVNICRSLDAIKKYYRLHCITRKRHALPPQPGAFFRNIYEHVISKNLGFVALAFHGKTNIAGSIFFNFQDKCSYKFGASDYTYQHLRANNLVMWEAIKWYAQNGYRSLCLGRTMLDNTGLRRFKTGWGVDEQIINYYKYDLRRDAFMAKTLHPKKAYRHIFGRMPIPLLRALGYLLYKHAG